MTELPTADYLRECFSYDPATGALTWKMRPLHHFKHAEAQAAFNGRFASKKAGCTTGRGYLCVTVDRVYYHAHRVIWAMQTGKWPEQLDHKNRDCGDNRWDNLREATHQENKWNRSRPERKLPRGVRKSRKGLRFTAQVKLNHRQIHLGSFDTPEEAHAAWCKAVRKERGEFFRPE